MKEQFGTQLVGQNEIRLGSDIGLRTPTRREPAELRMPTDAAVSVPIGKALEPPESEIGLPLS